MRHVLVWLVDLYRRFVSPLLPPSCRFAPSCSAYGREALLRHGALKGTLLTVWRVLRCNPFGRCGYDPVPERGRWRSDARTEHADANALANGQRAREP